MDEPRTCGKGLAERSALPARLGALSASMAENLEKHQQTLDLTDDNARKELDAYAVLANNYRNLASELQAIATRMAGYHDLPMGRHNGRALADPAIRVAFANFIERERDVVALLRTWIEQDQAILAEMSHSGAG